MAPALVQEDVIFPTNKFSRPTPPTSVPLHGLDFTPPIQIRNHRFYHKPPSPVASDLFSKLKSTLAEALELYPGVAGTVKLDEHGALVLAMDAKDRLGTPFITQIRDTPFTEEDDDLAARMAPILHPPTPTLAVKVTQFSCGTIVVAASLNHQVADLGGFLDFLEIWAQITRGEPIDFDKIPDDWTRTPGRFFPGLRNKSTIIPPGFQVQETPTQGPPTFLLSPSEATRWRFGKTEIEKLKTDFSPSTTGQMLDKWISSGDALAALVCGAITRARESCKIERMEGRSPADSDIELIAAAADGRDRAPNGDMQGKYYGNFNPLFFTAVSRSDLISLDNAAATRVAVAIRSALSEQLSPQALADKITFFESEENNTPPGRITWAADLIMTNWCKFDLKGPKLDLGWGQPFNTTSGNSGPYPPGYMIMTQDKRTGDVHLLMAIENAAGEALKEDVALNRYGEFISVV